MAILTIVLSILIGLAGLAKLAGAKPLSDQFTEFGLPIAFMYVVGVLELSAAVGLHFDLLTFWAAVGIALLMLGAIANHVKIKHTIGKTMPSVAILVMAVLVAYGHNELGR